MNTLPDLNTVPELADIYKNDERVINYIFFNFEDVLNHEVEYWYTVEPRGTEHQNYKVYQSNRSGKNMNTDNKLTVMDGIDSQPFEGKGTIIKVFQEEIMKTDYLLQREFAKKVMENFNNEIEQTLITCGIKYQIVDDMILIDKNEIETKSQPFDKRHLEMQLRGHCDSMVIQ